MKEEWLTRLDRRLRACRGKDISGITTKELRDYVTRTELSFFPPGIRRVPSQKDFDGEISKMIQNGRVTPILTVYSPSGLALAFPSLDNIGHLLQDPANGDAFDVNPKKDVEMKLTITDAF